jgi:hypothetical protein
MRKTLSPRPGGHEGPFPDKAAIYCGHPPKRANNHFFRYFSLTKSSGIVNFLLNAGSIELRRIKLLTKKPLELIIPDYEKNRLSF